uniref:Chromosome 9 open reading frame 43 n=1 Tax=Rhinolophus ferrumequinum TaxID=59479 RepID=A0A671FAU9_RHIFE
MDLPDESQWDETTCNLAVCQHPQCWATIRRIERGHPRILGSPCRAPLDANDKLPVLTIVNISDSCFPAKRHAHHHLSEFTFTKPHSLLSQRSKLDSKFQGRPWMDLPDKDLINYANRPPNLPVLNLNETQLPCPQDIRNKVVIWIPREPEKHMTQDGKKKRKTATKDKPPLVLSGKQNTETQLRPSGKIEPPSFPVHLFEQLSSEFIPFWNQFDMLPQDLLNDLLSGAGETTPCPEMKTQLAMMKKKPPLEKSRPDSAISSKMVLSVHHLTLQRPALRHPEHLKKVRYDLKTEGHGEQQQQQWQQQRLPKTPTKKQEAKKKSKNDPGSQRTSLTRLGAMVYDPCPGHRTLPDLGSDEKQQQQMKRKGPTLKQNPTERPQVDDAENDQDYLPRKQNPKLSKREPTNEDINTQIEVVWEAQERTPKDLSAGTSRKSWNPELKLLRILQAPDYEDEDNQPCGAE